MRKRFADLLREKALIRSLKKLPLVPPDQLPGLVGVGAAFQHQVAKRPEIPVVGLLRCPLALQILCFQLFQHVAEFLPLHGLEQIIRHAVSQHGHGVIEIVVAADRQHHRRVGQLPAALGQGDAVHFGHLDVRDQQIDRVRLQNLQRFLSVPGFINFLHRDVGTLEHGFEAQTDELFILRDQNRFHWCSPSFS